MYDILREIIFYVSFLWILLFIGYGLRDPNAYLLKTQLGHVFVDKGYDSPATSPKTDFMKVLVAVCEHGALVVLACVCSDCVEMRSI